MATPCYRVYTQQIFNCYHGWLRELLMTLTSPHMARSRLSGSKMLCPECILICKTEQASGLYGNSSADFEGCPYMQLA